MWIHVGLRAVPVSQHVALASVFGRLPDVVAAAAAVDKPAASSGRAKCAASSALFADRWMIT